MLGVTRRRLTGLLLAAAVVVVVPVLGPTGAAGSTSAQTWAWPASGTLAISGHGSGHGHGLSQWGAYGAAESGLTARQILDFYYPGTAAATLTEPTLRVRILEDDNALDVLPQSGLRATTTDGAPTLPTTIGGTLVKRWEADRITSAGIRLRWYDGAVWHPWAIGGKNEHSGVVEFSGSGPVQVVLGSSTRAYRGSVRAVPAGAVPGQHTVVITTVRDYLRSVVPSEMPAGWSPAALQAQSVAARTFALYERAHQPAGSDSDTCDTTACQVFSGTAAESTNSTTAVLATTGQVRLYNSALALTQFSASSGGWASDGGLPYLPAHPDPYDDVVPNDKHSWTDTISAATLQAAYPSIGALRSVSVTRDGNGEWGGRMTTVVLTGTSGHVTVTGAALRTAAGLKSTWWAPSNAGWSGYDAVLGLHDWNGDTRDDLVTRTQSGDLWLYPGTGGATLGTRQRIGTGFWPFAPLLGPGDWNGDAAPDLVARRTSDGTLWLFPGTGSGGITAGRQIGTGFRSFTALLAPGDWNGDGAADLIGRRADGTLWLYPGTGHGGFGSSTQIGTGFGAFSALLGPGDWDGDGAPDLLARRSSDATLWLYPGTGHGGFVPGAWRQVGTGWGSFRLLAAGNDLDGDTHPDLVAVTTANTAYLYPGTGAGGFRPRSTIGTP